MVITQSHIYQPLFYLQLDPNEIVRDGSQNRKQRGQYSFPPRHSQRYKIFRAEVWSALSSWLPFRSAIAFQIIDFALIIHIGSPGGLVGGATEGQRLRKGYPPTFHLTSIIAQSGQTGKASLSGLVLLLITHSKALSLTWLNAWERTAAESDKPNHKMTPITLIFSSLALSLNLFFNVCTYGTVKLRHQARLHSTVGTWKESLYPLVVWSVGVFENWMWVSFNLKSKSAC